MLALPALFMYLFMALSFFLVWACDAPACQRKVELVELVEAEATELKPLVLHMQVETDTPAPTRIAFEVPRTSAGRALVKQLIAAVDAQIDAANHNANHNQEWSW